MRTLKINEKFQELIMHDTLWGEIWEDMAEKDEEVTTKAEGIFWNGQYYTIVKSGYVSMITLSILTALRLFNDTPEFYKEIHYV